MGRGCGAVGGGRGQSGWVVVVGRGRGVGVETDMIMKLAVPRL